MTRKNSGFTIIELMIVVVIIGILAAVAYPLYETRVQKTRMANAKPALEAARFAMEKHRTTSGSFPAAGYDVNMLYGFANSEWNRNDKYLYEIEVSQSTANTFLLTASCDIDDDGEKDEWTINQRGEFSHKENDLED